MFHPNGATYLYLTVILLILARSEFVITLSEKIIPRVGDLCCFEDWEKAVGKFHAAAVLGSVDSLNTSKYQVEFVRWAKGIPEYHTGTPRGICAGFLNFVCNQKSRKCECASTGPYKYLPTKNRRCVGDREAACKIPGGEIVMYCRKGYKCVEHPNATDKLERCEVDPNAPSIAMTIDDEIDLDFRSGGSMNDARRGYPPIWLLMIGFVFSIMYTLKIIF